MNDSKTLVIDLFERETRRFPKEMLYDQFGNSLIFESTRKLSVIDLRDTINGIELRVLGIVGLLPLTSEIIINIKPKFPIVNLWEMVRISDVSCDSLLPFLRSYEVNDSDVPLKVLLKSFCFFLRPILDSSFTRKYKLEEEDGFYRPSLNFGRTLKKHILKGNHYTVASDVFIFSRDIVLNQVIKKSCLAFLQKSRLLNNVEEEKNILIEALSILEVLEPRHMNPDYHTLLNQADSVNKKHYDGLLTTYAILLGYKKIGFSFNPDGTRMPSFLFNMDVVFENFIRNCISNYFMKFGVRVFDGNQKKHQGILFSDNKRFPVKPDLIFKKGKVPIMLGEVKYKPKIDESDRYQLISHATALKTSVALWISPSMDENTDLEFIGTINSGIEFYHCKFSLKGDIKNSIEQMNQSIKKSLLKLE